MLGGRRPVALVNRDFAPPGARFLRILRGTGFVVAFAVIMPVELGQGRRQQALGEQNQLRQTLPAWPSYFVFMIHSPFQFSGGGSDLKCMQRST
jgi:hypothetical protein